MAQEKIMVVDDNRDFLEELKEILDYSGYYPIVVSDPRIVLGAARSFLPDVILLDLKMSGASGFQVAEQLKKSQDTSGIPIICMSGYFPVDKPSILLDTGNMAACMKKPFGVLELLTQIEKILATVRSGKSDGIYVISERDEY